MAIKKKRTAKWWIGQVHLWLGLASGIVVLIVSITGCLFVFQKEISEATNKELYFVQPQPTAVLPASTLLRNAQAALGADQPINFFTAYKEPNRAWEFMAYKENDSVLTYMGSMVYYRSAFVNPYTGAVTGIKDYRYNFFVVVKAIHWSLFLQTEIGQPIVGYSTLIFVIMLITGLVLWWPKKWNRAGRERSFKIKWNASFKRVNYDLHNVPGFYSLLPALIIAMTGMVFAFRWFYGLVYVAAAGTTTPPPQVIVKSMPSARDTAVMAGLDVAYTEALRQMPDVARLGISPAEGKEASIWVAGYRDKETYYGYDALQFDQYSGKLLNRRNNSEKNRGERLLEMNYDIHVGAIAGIPGKIIAFIISIVCASLPVTGFLVWRGRGRAAKRKPAEAAKSPFQEAVPMV